MKLRKRIIAGVGAPLVLAGLLLSGAAAARPSVVTSPTLPDTVKFTATLIVGTSTATVNSTACTLTDDNAHTFSCRVSGAGSFVTTTDGGNNTLATRVSETAHVAITGAFGPIALTLSGSQCLTGSGTAVTPTGPVAVNAKADITNVTELGTSNVFTIKGTIKVKTGNVSCAV